MLVTTFVLLGVEGASVYSRFARRREDVGRATLLGFLSVLAIFASVTMVVLRRLATRSVGKHSSTLDGRGSGVCGGALGSDLHQHWCDHLGSGRLPGLDIDQRGGLVHTRHDRRNAQVPCQEQQEPHADRRIDHDERSGSGVATQSLPSLESSSFPPATWRSDQPPAKCCNVCIVTGTHVYVRFHTSLAWSADLLHLRWASDAPGRGV